MPFDRHNYRSISVWYSQENRTAAPRKRKTTFSCQTTTTEISTWLRQASAILTLPGTRTGQLRHSKFVLDTQLLAFGEAGKRICKVKPLSGKGRNPHRSSRLSPWWQHSCCPRGSKHPSVNGAIYTEPKHTQGLPQFRSDQSLVFLSPHSL